MNKLRDIVDRKILDLKSSLHAVGNWSLTSEYRRYAINNSKWNSMGSDWQKKEFIKFLKDSKQIGKNESEIGKKYKGLNVAKKPGQKKRPVNERTK